MIGSFLLHLRNGGALNYFLPSGNDQFIVILNVLTEGDSAVRSQFFYCDIKFWVVMVDRILRVDTNVALHLFVEVVHELHHLRFRL
jgi:hypothetical protein